MHLSRNLMTVMKSSLVGTFLLLFLSCTVSGLGSVVSRNYSYIEIHYTWQEAQSYCRNFGGQNDLATFHKLSDSEDLDLKSYHAWIGLYREGGSNSGSPEQGGPNRRGPKRRGPKRWGPSLWGPSLWGPSLWGSNPGDNSWTWTKGGHFNFDPNYEPSYGENCGYVYYMDNNEMIGGADCQSYYFFICDQSHFNPESKTWSEAKDSCQSTNLANYNDQGDVNGNVNQQDFPVWIGLYREGETWNWSAGVSDYTNWGPHEPMNNGDCVTISSLSKQMATQNCSDRFPFICYGDNLLLVNESKTWEEALEYCRALSYELVSVQPEDYDYMRSRVMEANTEEVWTGLRFLAGEWLWVNGADMMYSDLPLCPPMVQHCGTLSKNGTGSMEIRDCAERRNFLCYWM